MHYLYEPVSKGVATKFLTSYSDALPLAVRVPNSLATQFIVKEVALLNRSGGTAFCGIGGRLPASLMAFGFWDDSEEAAGTPFISDLADVIDGSSATTANLSTVGTNNDGFVVGCDVEFNVVSLNLAQALDANEVLEFKYSALDANGLGTWSTLTTYVTPDFAAANEQLLWFEPPHDWVAVTAASAVAGRHGAGVPQKKCIRMRATTAPDATRGTVHTVVLGRVFYTAPVGDGLTLYAAENELQLPAQCDALMACFSVANAGNRATALYRFR